MPQLLETPANGVKFPPLGDVVTLEKKFREILHDQPHNSEAHFVLGMVAFRDGRTEAAIDPTNADFPYALGTAFARLGRASDVFFGHSDVRRQSISLKC